MVCLVDSFEDKHVNIAVSMIALSEDRYYNMVTTNKKDHGATRIDRKRLIISE